VFDTDQPSGDGVGFVVVLDVDAQTTGRDYHRRFFRLTVTG
jgi:hypothetical protein